MNNLGDVYGEFDDTFTEVEYGGPGGEGKYDITGLKGIPAFYVVRRDGTITFLDGGSNSFFRFSMFIEAGQLMPRMNDRRVMVFDGSTSNEDKRTYPLAINATQPGNNWSPVPFPSMNYNYKRSLAINNQNEVVGYGLRDELVNGNPWKASHAIASLRTGALDLNTLIPGSDWVLSRASDINDCGEIVGLAYNPKLDLFRGFLLSPKGCR
jgi:hypothetical protein